MQLGLVGLPNCGKSTLFGALTGVKSGSAAHAFSTTDKSVGIVAVADERLFELQKMYDAKKLVNTTIEFVDIPSLVKGSGDGAGLGNKFLSHIREVDGIVQVVRCFEDENVMHVDGNLDPARDMETIDLELIFADMEQVAKRIEKVKKEAKSAKGAAAKDEIALLERVLAGLEDEKPVWSLPFTPDEEAALVHYGLLTFKTMIYVANVGEDDYAGADSHPHVIAMKNYLANKYPGEEREVFVVSAQMEEELIGMDEEEKTEFLAMIGATKSATPKLTNAAYSSLGLMSFLTAGPKEVRGWTIKKGTPAKKAGGKIHSDIERGFIRAEVVNFDVLMEKGSYAACKDAGVLRLEGKDYIIQEGDIVEFRFNV